MPRATTPKAAPPAMAPAMRARGVRNGDNNQDGQADAIEQVDLLRRHVPNCAAEQVIDRRSAVKRYRSFAAEHGGVNLDPDAYQALVRQTLLPSKPRPSCSY
jgi:hypothetical protein